MPPPGMPWQRASYTTPSARARTIVAVTLAAQAQCYWPRYGYATSASSGALIGQHSLRASRAFKAIRHGSMSTPRRDDDAIEPTPQDKAYSSKHASFHHTHITSFRRKGPSDGHHDDARLDEQYHDDERRDIYAITDDWIYFISMYAIDEVAGLHQQQI